MNCCPSGTSSTPSAKSECWRGTNFPPDEMNSPRSAMHWCPSGTHCTPTATDSTLDARNFGWSGVDSAPHPIHSCRSATWSRLPGDRISRIRSREGQALLPATSGSGVYGEKWRRGLPILAVRLGPLRTVALRADTPQVARGNNCHPPAGNGCAPVGVRVGIGPLGVVESRG